MADKAEGAETCGTRHQGDKVALEADDLYIRVARNQILGRPFLPCSILAEDYAKELLADSKELADWQTLFADILRASKDSSHATVDAILVERWQENILRMPLRTPGRIRTRLLASSAKDSEISADKRSPGIHAQDTLDIDVDFTVEPETYKEWNQVGLPPSLVSTIQSMEQGLDKSNTAILGLHRDFSAMGGVMADDVHALDCRVERLQTTVGLPKAVPGVLNGNVWDVLQAMDETNATNPTSSVAAIDVQTRLGSLAASATAAQQELSSLLVEKDGLASNVARLETQLTATLEIAVDLRAPGWAHGAGWYKGSHNKRGAFKALTGSFYPSQHWNRWTLARGVWINYHTVQFDFGQSMCRA
jgi:hypothetical protein